MVLDRKYDDVHVKIRIHLIAYTKEWLLIKKNNKRMVVPKNNVD